MAKTTMPVAVVGVVEMTTTSPTARRGRSRTWITGPPVLVKKLGSNAACFACVSSLVEALNERESVGSCKSAS